MQGFENYFIDSELLQREDKFLVLCIYDICDNRRRARFVRLLEEYGLRVQKSAFELKISQRQYNVLLSRIPKRISDEDNVRIYKLRLNTEIVSWGSGISFDDETIIL